MNRISRILIALILTVSMVTEPVTVAMAVEADSTGEGYIQEEIQPLEPIEIDSINLSNEKDVTIQWTPQEGKTVILEKSLTGEELSWETVDAVIENGSYTDTDTEYGKTYYYRLKTVNSANEEEYVYSKVAKQTIANMQLDAPDLKNLEFIKSNKVELTWTNVEKATSYRVWRKSGTGTWTVIATVEPAEGKITVYIDENVSTTKIHCYKIQPVVEGVNTDEVYSAERKGHSPFGAVSVAKPTASIGYITVKWSKVNFATEYKVYRKTSGGSWSLIKTVKAGNALSYKDTNVGSRVKYYYKVIPKSDYTTGTKYNSVSVYSRLYKTSVSVSEKSTTFVSLKWKKVSNANIYAVYKSVNGKNWYKVKETKNLSYKVTNLTSKKKYYFKVRAYCRNNGKNLDYRDSSAIKTATRFASTKQVTIWRTQSTATIKWEKVSGADKYWVYMSSDLGKTYKKIYSGTSRSIKKSNISEKKTYYFRVYAIDKVGGLETRSVAYTKKSLASKYNNFTMLNLDSNKFLKMMKKRSTTNYYLGTPYGSIKDDPNIVVTEAGFTRPNGMKTTKKRRMNCAGFIGSIFRDAGADLTVVRQMGYSNGTVNACNWVAFFEYSDVKKYKYRSIKSLLNSGRAEKGDIICRVPDKYDKEKNHDYHMMVFWGSNSHQNKMWHSTIQGGRSCNQISALPEQSYSCTYILVKLKR